MKKKMRSIKCSVQFGLIERRKPILPRESRWYRRETWCQDWRQRFLQSVGSRGFKRYESFRIAIETNGTRAGDEGFVVDLGSAREHEFARVWGSGGFDTKKIRGG